MVMIMVGMLMVVKICLLGLIGIVIVVIQKVGIIVEVMRCNKRRVSVIVVVVVGCCKLKVKVE